MKEYLSIDGIISKIQRMNKVDDVRGVGVIKMMMVDDMGGGGCQK